MRCVLALWVATVLAFAAVTPRAGADVTLLAGGEARCAIFVAPAVMAPPGVGVQALKGAAREGESQRRRLGESVRDLAACLGKMSGAKVEIIQGGPAATDSRMPILIGELALKRFGPVGKSSPYRQAFRVVVAGGGVGLMGESDLATSYAIYELLDRLGCRWYMPGDLGEVIPRRDTISLKDMDFTSAPATVYRGGPPSDADFQRRNRLGGMACVCGFGSVEGYVAADQRREHPDWVATVGGKPHPYRLRWSSTGVAHAIAEHILGMEAKDPQPTVSFFVGGGSDFDESPEDRALDGGDNDPIFHDVSVSDRLLVLANRVGDEIAAKAPDALLLTSAYTRALRAPVRGHAHANVVPVIVASVYDRAHPLTDAAAPGNADLLRAIEGWGRAAAMTGDYAYTYNLAEPTAPNPMIARWSADLPILIKNNCRFWIPESPPNFETSLPGHYLTFRLTWDPAQDSGAIIDRLMTEFYGHAGTAMKAYWQCMDDAWAKTPVYAGGEFGYSQRFTPELLTRVRRLMDQAVATAATPAEQGRVRMAGESLRGLESLMALRRDLADGRFAGLAARNEARHQRLAALGKEYRPQAAFGNAGMMPAMSRAFADADRISGTCAVLTSPPLRNWRFFVDADRRGAALGASGGEFEDKGWKTTDSCVDTWSTLGLENYYGQVWYRTRVDLPTVGAGKKVYLWISATDGTARVYVNGHAARVLSDPGAAGKSEAPAAGEVFTGFCQPVSFDITPAVHPGGSNEIAILCERTELNELGTGGLMGPVVVYAEK